VSTPTSPGSGTSVCSASAGAAAEAASAHVEQAPAAHVLGELQDDIDRAGRRDLPIVVDPARRRH